MTTSDALELQDVLDAMPLMFFFKDTENRILRTNRAAADAVGATVETLMGALSTEWFPDEAGAYHADDLRVIQSGRPRLAIIEPFQTEDGTKHWIRTDKFPHHAHDGTVDGVLVFIQDASELAQREELLRDKAEQLESLLDAGTNAAILLDETGSILAANQTAKHLLAVDDADINNSTVSDFLTSEHSAACQRALRSAQGGTDARLLHTIVDRKGVSRWLESTFSRRTQRAGIILLTARVRRLEPHGPSDLGAASHDLTNWLLTARLTSDVLRAAIDDSDDATRSTLRGHLTRLEEAHLRSNEILEELVSEWSTPGDATPDGFSEQLVPQLNRVRASLPAGWRLSFDLRPALAPTPFDPNAVVNVLVALLARCADRSIDGTGAVTISTSVASHDENPHTRILVNLHDSALPVDTLKSITRSVRDSNEANSPWKGLSDLEAFGVSVRALEHLGQPCFEVLLPSSIGVEQHNAKDLLKADTVLVVDDEDMVRSLLSTILQNAGHNAATATNGHDAVKLFANNRDAICAVVLDANMPGLGGVETFHQLVAIDPTLPVLFSSGLPDMTQELVEHRVGFIQKPYSAQELLHRLDSVMSLGVPRNGPQTNRA